MEGAAESSLNDQYCRLELNINEANALTRHLPVQYSLQHDTKAPKRINSKTAIILEQKPKKLVASWIDIKAMPNLSKPARSAKLNAKFSYQQDAESEKFENLQRELSTSRRNHYEGISQAVRPCIRILNLLKNSRTSWPFRQPVDPIAMNIPNYTTIIKQPMDLSTVQKNLKSCQYVTPTQFHADVSKIIKNSLLFNENHPTFIEVTREFEEYYDKITMEPTFERTSSSYSDNFDRGIIIQKKKKIQTSINDQQAITLAERKELGINIKKLPKEHMSGILDIVNQRKVKVVGEFDLKELQPNIIRKLQNFVREKLSAQKQKQRSAEYYGMEEKQSPFEIENQDDS